MARCGDALVWQWWFLWFPTSSVIAFVGASGCPLLGPPHPHPLPSTSLYCWHCRQVGLCGYKAPPAVVVVVVEAVVCTQVVHFLLPCELLCCAIFSSNLCGNPTARTHPPLPFPAAWIQP